MPVVVLTIYGYDWIHRFQRWMTAILGITFAIVFVEAINRGGLGGGRGLHSPPLIRGIHGSHRPVRDRHGELGTVRL